MNGGDAELVARLRQGDTSAFAAIYDKHGKVIFNVIYRMVTNHEDAMDVTQSVFLKVHQKIESFDPAYRFFSWLYKIAVNESINHLQNVKRRRDREPYPPSTQPTPAENFSEVEKADQLHTALATLEYDYRVILVLKYFLQLSYREIGRILDVPEKRVKSRLFTARLQMRDLLTQQGYRR